MKTIAIIIAAVSLSSCSVEQSADATRNVALFSKQVSAFDAALKAYAVSSK